MKSTPSEYISTLRKKISFQSSFILLLLLIAAMVLIAVAVISKELHPFYKGAAMIILPTLFVAAFMIYRRRSGILHTLDHSMPEASLSRLENFLQREYERFRGSDILRLAAGTVLTVVMLLLVFFMPGNVFTGQIFALWLGLILLSMMKAWMLMQGGIMLQDIKHVLRDQSSEIS